MTYWYSAYTIDKRIVQGTIDAGSERMAEEALYRAGYHLVLKLREKGRGATLSRVLPSFFGVKTQDVIEFSRQLATLMESGIPVLTAMELLREQTPHTAIREVIAGLTRCLKEGSSFSQALAKYPQAFSNTYCQVMKASEVMGNLESALKQMADYMEKEMAARKKVGYAMIYPALVLLMAAGVFTILVIVALPPLVRLFTSLGGELPWTTRLLLAMGVFFIKSKFYLLVALATLVVSLAGYMRLPSGKRNMDRLVLKTPVINSINIHRNMGRFCQTASMMLKAGIPLSQIMNIATRTVGNVIIRESLIEVKGNLLQGQGFSQSMAAIPLFPRLLVEMIVVGETAGTLDATLATMADYYEQKVEQRMRALVSMIEPALIIAVGMVVAFIAVSMISPLYSILKTIH